MSWGFKYDDEDDALFDSCVNTGCGRVCDLVCMTSEV